MNITKSNWIFIIGVNVSKLPYFLRQFENEVFSLFIQMIYFFFPTCALVSLNLIPVRMTYVEFSKYEMIYELVELSRVHLFNEFNCIKLLKQWLNQTVHYFKFSCRVIKWRILLIEIDLDCLCKWNQAEWEANTSQILFHQSTCRKLIIEIEHFGCETPPRTKDLTKISIFSAKLTNRHSTFSTNPLN